MSDSQAGVGMDLLAGVKIDFLLKRVAELEKKLGMDADKGG